MSCIFFYTKEICAWSYFRLNGSLSTVSSPQTTEHVHHVRFPLNPLQTATQSEAAFLQQTSTSESAFNSGLTTPLSFLGAFSSSGGSPTWFDNGGSMCSQGSSGGANSVSDALQLLLQGITVLPAGSAVPTAAAMLLGGDRARHADTESEKESEREHPA